MNISFIGAGNVATHLAKAFIQAGQTIVGVHTRSLASAEAFANTYHCVNAPTLAALPESDVYVFAVKDDALPEVVAHFAELHRTGLCIHTAGSVALSVFLNQGIKRCGVFYPMQTFSKDKVLDYTTLPIFLETAHTDDEVMLEQLALKFTSKVYHLDSEDRKLLHLAAVFACNFSNHCFAIAEDLLAKAGLSGELLLPLIDETCLKLHTMPAIKSQTGPAVRYDQKVMQRQLALLSEDPLRQAIYRVVSESIHDFATKQ